MSVAREDVELLAAIREGHPDAFDRFVERWGPRLLAFGRRMCRHREDGEDVFQETLVRAYQALEDLRDPGALRSWLFRVAANQCRMKRRREPPQRELPLEELKPPGWSEGQPVELADWSRLPSDDARRAEIREWIEEGLSELSPVLRMVVLLRDVEGLDTRETADALAIEESAVKMRLHRGRMALRRHLGEKLGETAA